MNEIRIYINYMDFIQKRTPYVAISRSNETGKAIAKTILKEVAQKFGTKPFVTVSQDRIEIADFKI